jgi:hypothetical protein
LPAGVARTAAPGVESASVARTPAGASPAAAPLGLARTAAPEPAAAPRAAGIARSTAPGGRIARAAARAAGATAPAAAVARATAADEVPRPHLQLVASEPAPAPTPPPAPAAARQIARATAESLAEATGGAIELGAGGMQSVTFPAPGNAGSASLPYIPPFSTEPVTVARAETDAPAASTPSTPSTPVDHPPAEGGGSLDLDKVYDEFLDRFKRDLLIEREQSGHLLIDNP